MAQNFKNILIIKPSSLGDIVLALPALSALRRTYPGVRISWLIRPEFASLIEGHPDLNEIIYFDRKFLGRAWHDIKALKALITLIKKLRECRFDIVFDFQGLFRTAALSWFSGCKNRLGMSNAREFASVFYTKSISQDQDSIHLVDYYMKIIKSAGITDTKVRFILPHNISAQQDMKKLLSENNINNEKYVVFIPGSAHLNKCWPAKRFAALADKINNRFAMPIVATGTRAEQALVEKVQRQTKTSVINLAGQTNLVQLTELLRDAAVVVSNDTGPAHIAGALGVKLVLICGRSNPLRIAPYQRHDCIVAADIDGRGIKHKSSKPEHDVTVITLEQVFQKVCEQLSENGK